MRTQQRHEIRIEPAPAKFDLDPEPPTPGMRTTEFWLSLVAVAAVLAAVVATDDPWARAAGWMFAAVMVSCYVVSRGLAKLAAGRSAAARLADRRAGDTADAPGEATRR
jgi:hypothetical protein